MPIFNSLGSNYDLSYVLKYLFSSGSKNDSEKLKNLIEQRYGGKAFLFYKGRQAITFALKILNLPKDSRVAINGFTCVAVFNAIRKAGFEPLCLDLVNDSNLNFGANTLEKTLKSKRNIRVVIVQNTLGYPCDIEKINQICKKNKLILIEDLAHCVGTKYQDGREAGNVGDFTILSFSQDKIIDAVSGGALIIRNKNFVNTERVGVKLIHPPGVQVMKDKAYPFFTYKIRFLYKFGVGKHYHFSLRKLNLLSDIMNPSLYDFYSLPNWNAKMALYQFKFLEKQLAHRRKIARIYALKLPKTLLPNLSSFPFHPSTNLRFPVLVENRTNLINHLKKSGIFVSDIWYDDVAPECPVAVSVSKRILNLPTHINISEHDAIKICGLINKWLKLQ